MTPRSGNTYTCGYCKYTGPCYGESWATGVTAPWCPKCGKNDKLEPSKTEEIQNKSKSYGALRPTALLRWHNPPFFDISDHLSIHPSRGTLQQAFKDVETDEVIWRDVLTVKD